MSPDDYPQQDFNAGIQGEVGIELFFGLDGRPYRCSVFASSGSQSLDEASCIPKLRRAHIKPALDEAGAPVYSAISMRTMWINPNNWAKNVDEKPMARRIFKVAGADSNFSAGTTIALLVERDGRVSGCRPGQLSSNKQLAEVACKRMAQTGVEPITGEQNQKVRAVVTWPVLLTGQSDPSLPTAGETFETAKRGK